MDMAPHRHLIKFAFDGAHFEGYARQPGRSTVVGELLRAIEASGVAGSAEEARFASAGRLDRGVSAVGAAAALDADIPSKEVLHRLNGQARAVIVHCIAAVEPGFDPRRRARSRWYRYHFPSPSPGGEMDVALMRRAAAMFVGEHDFSALARLEGRDPHRRVLDAVVSQVEGTLVLDVRGESFLWNQVRRMATAVEMVGTGALSLEGLSRVLSTGEGGPFRTAPARGLLLMDVEYDGLDLQAVGRLPKGTVRRLQEDDHRAICQAMYLDHLRRLVPF